VTASGGTYIEPRSWVPGGAFLDNIFNQVLRLGCAPSCDEVVTIFKECVLSFIQRTIIRYPILDTLLIPGWYFGQSPHVDILQQKRVCVKSITFPKTTRAVEPTVCVQLDFNLVQQFLLGRVPIVIMLEGCKPVFQTPFRVCLVELVEFRCKFAQFDFLSQQDASCFISKFTKDAEAIV
jgi:hypothetical protein